MGVRDLVRRSRAREYHTPAVAVPGLSRATTLARPAVPPLNRDQQPGRRSPPETPPNADIQRCSPRGLEWLSVVSTANLRSPEQSRAFGPRKKERRLEMTSLLLKPAQVADALKVSRATVYRMVGRAGKALPRFRSEDKPLQHRGGADVSSRRSRRSRKDLRKQGVESDLDAEISELAEVEQTHLDDLISKLSEVERRLEVAEAKLGANWSEPGAK